MDSLQTSAKTLYQNCALIIINCMYFAPFAIMMKIIMNAADQIKPTQAEKNVLFQHQLSVLTLILVLIPCLCYCSST